MTKSDVVELQTRHSGQDELRIYIHTKTNGIYSWQCEATMESDGKQMTVYSNLVTKKIYVRPSQEFYDGRFELVTDEDYDNALFAKAIEKARNSAKKLGEAITKYEDFIR